MQFLSNRDGRSLRGEDRANEAAHLLLAHALEIVDPLHAEEFSEAELPHELPIRAQRAVGDIQAVEGDVGDRQILRATREDFVMCVQDEFCHVRGGGY